MAVADALLRVEKFAAPESYTGLFEGCRQPSDKAGNLIRCRFRHPQRNAHAVGTRRRYVQKQERHDLSAEPLGVGGLGRKSRCA